MRLGILGGGRAAWAFGSTWRQIGWPLAGVWLRDGSTSRVPDLLGTSRVPLADLAHESEVLFVAVTDSALAEVVDLIPETDAIIFHASGSLGSVRGGFSLHPLRALPAVGEPSDLAGTLLVFEGCCRHTARLIAAAANARLAEIDPASKPLYHAAAVFGANYVAAVADIAERLIEEAGVHDAHEDVYRLALSALTNWRDQTGTARFTGPAARGEQETLTAHAAALTHHPQLAEIYELLAAEIRRSLVATDD
ncbi:MAG: DUF2520 domain-containing protein [Thermoanaerobaculia bacterium]